MVLQIVIDGGVGVYEALTYLLERMNESQLPFGAQWWAK
jgi:hypothetical protein